MDQPAGIPPPLPPPPPPPPRGVVLIELNPIEPRQMMMMKSVICDRVAVANQFAAAVDGKPDDFTELRRSS